MSGAAPRALSEWLRLMLAEIAAKRADSERARGEATRRAAESDAVPHAAQPAAPAARNRKRRVMR
jgi:hypothetical protein